MCYSAYLLIKEIKNGRFDERLISLYGDGEQIIEQRTRYIHAIEEFIRRFGEREIEVYSAPGRTEISGNHTDHQKGRVLAAAVNLDTVAFVAKTDDDIITIKSEGYGEICIDLNNAEYKKEEEGTSIALIKGVINGCKKRGYDVKGFVAYIVSDVLSGSGLSSSAAYEVLIGNIILGLFNKGKSNPVEIAVISREAEVEYFGKPCGLMDQMASSVGSLVEIDFADNENPDIEKIDADFLDYGYALCVVDTGGSHADLTDDYAAVPYEMKEVAAHFGKDYLSEVDEQSFYEDIKKLRELYGDRAVLRCIHWFDENNRVKQQAKVLKEGDFSRYLEMVNESGKSSYELLQNVYSSKFPKEQGLSLALIMTKKILGDSAVCRVHGGGFAGTIQAYVKCDEIEKYRLEMEKVFGEGSVYVLSVRKTGGMRVF